MNESHVFGVRLSLLAGSDLIDAIIRQARAAGSGYVCVANVHQVIEARRSAALADALARASIVSTDSRILERALVSLGKTYSSPVLYSPDLLQLLFEQAALHDLSVALFGASQDTLEALVAMAQEAVPGLKIVHAFAPPIGSVTTLAGEEFLAPIRAARPDLLLVSLGCPKQELWMAKVSASVPTVMVGLGGAFGFYAGTNRRSPAWVHSAGLEWLYRLFVEPRRLFGRYLNSNPAFLWLWLRKYLRTRLSGSSLD